MYMFTDASNINSHRGTRELAARLRVDWYKPFGAHL